LYHLMAVGRSRNKFGMTDKHIRILSLRSRMTGGIRMTIEVSLSPYSL